MSDIFPMIIKAVVFKISIVLSIFFYWAFLCDKGEDIPNKGALDKNLVEYNLYAKVIVAIIGAFVVFILSSFAVILWEENKLFPAICLATFVFAASIWTIDHYLIRKISFDRCNIYTFRPFLGVKIYPRAKVSRVIETREGLFTFIVLDSKKFLCVGDAMKGRNRFVNSLGRSTII